MIAICILGMHRSGTSTITRGLNLLGAYLGEEKDTVKPLPDNPEGFWERFDIYYLQERLLNIMKREWNTSAPLPENWHRTEEVRPFRDELVELVRKNFLGRPLWLWKDPRTCLLLPLWKDVLSELGIGLKVVYVVRNPLDVARSLEKRNGFTIDKGLGIWFNYTISALKGLEGLEPIFLSYDRFLNDWNTELKRCADNLGIEWPVDESLLREKMSRFVRHDLRHSASGLNELCTVNPPKPVMRLYEHLLELQSGEVKSKVATESMTELMYQEFFSYARFFESDLAALGDCRSRLEEMSTSPETPLALVEMKKALDVRTQWAWELNEELKANKELISSLQNSLSWSITKPLRFVHRFLLKLRKDH